MHVSDLTFGVGGADAPMKVTFILGPDGKATEMFMKRGAQEMTARRVK